MKPNFKPTKPDPRVLILQIICTSMFFLYKPACCRAVFCYDSHCRNRIAELEKGCRSVRRLHPFSVPFVAASKARHSGGIGYFLNVFSARGADLSRLSAMRAAGVSDANERAAYCIVPLAYPASGVDSAGCNLPIYSDHNQGNYLCE